MTSFASREMTGQEMVNTCTAPQMAHLIQVLRQTIRNKDKEIEKWVDMVRKANMPMPEPEPEHPAINGYNRYDYTPVEGIRQPKPEPKELTMKFETINGTLCRMVEPTPLTPEATFPCVVRLIQDDSPMGRYNLKLRNTALEPLVVTGIAKDIGVVTHLVPRPHFSCECYEILGYPVEEGSRWWALYQMMQGKKVSYKSAIGNVCWALNQDGNVQFCHMDNLAYIGSVRSKLEFAENYALETGWKLYEEKPETAKEPEIVAHKQHANCLVCGKEIEGLLDGHATVSIKRYSISSLYDSTYSHYCGKCFLELGFDATERELRNRQQPIAEPEPEPAVGDWVEFRDIEGIKHGIIEGRREEYSVLCNGVSQSVGDKFIIRKLDPSEVVVDFGSGIKGTIVGCSNVVPVIKVINGVDWIARIMITALDTATREMVEKLLKAQEGE